MRPTLCLNMIVKDEAHVIQRCLTSVLPLIDSWAIVDTGSSDGTQDVIRKLLGHLPGELVERPWVDFAHNRNEALQLAHGRAEYALLMDADNELAVDNPDRFDNLTDEAYRVEFVLGETRYFQSLLVRLDVSWQWRGVLHEALYADQEVSYGILPGVQVLERREGARSLRPQAEKYAEDVAVLIQGLKKEPHNSRYVFYLAQSYRDAGQLEKALRTYVKRSEMGGWDEEVYYSLLQAAVLSERLSLNDDVVVGRYLAAYEARPQRAESLTYLTRYYREHGKRWASAHLMAQAAIATPRPSDILFVDESVYSWRALDEYAIACYWTGRYEESARVCQELLVGGAVPDEHVARVKGNLEFSQQKLSG